MVKVNPKSDVGQKVLGAVKKGTIRLLLVK
jgi:hypothetical protein